jgi:hypothetical protein
LGDVVDYGGDCHVGMEGRFANAGAIESDEGDVGLFCCVVEGSSFYVARYVACVCVCVGGGGGGGEGGGVRRGGVGKGGEEKRRKRGGAKSYHGYR